MLIETDTQRIHFYKLAYTLRLDLVGWQTYSYSREEGLDPLLCCVRPMEVV
jgi:hypothetical protein